MIRDSKECVFVKISVLWTTSQYEIYAKLSISYKMQWVPVNLTHRCDCFAKLLAV